MVRHNLLYADNGRAFNDDVLRSLGTWSQSVAATPRLAQRPFRRGPHAIRPMRARRYRLLQSHAPIAPREAYCSAAALFALRLDPLVHLAKGGPVRPVVGHSARFARQRSDHFASAVVVVARGFEAGKSLTRDGMVFTEFAADQRFWDLHPNMKWVPIKPTSGLRGEYGLIIRIQLHDPETVAPELRI